MTDTLNAAELRRWAMQCGAQADHPHASGDERERPLKMRASLLAIAADADWLDGKIKPVDARSAA